MGAVLSDSLRIYSHWRLWILKRTTKATRDLCIDCRLRMADRRGTILQEPINRNGLRYIRHNENC